MDYMPGMYPPSLPTSRQGTPSVPEQAVAFMTPTNVLHATKSTPPSSEQPSSTPPTPRNHPALSVTEPTIVTQTVPMARRGSNASATMPTYYDYSEQFEPTSKDATRMLSATLTTPTFGFAQRVRTILEERRGPASPASVETAIVVDELALEPPEHADEVHELEASPVIKRITRDLIRANLMHTSDGGNTATPNAGTSVKTTGETPGSITSEPPGLPQVSTTTPAAKSIHVRKHSKVSANGSIRSDTNTATAAMEYALRYPPPPEVAEDGNTVSDFLNIYGDDDRHMTTVMEEPTEPVTIATAEVEVAAPTPTQPRWKPSFDTPPDMLRTQSAVVSSSVYSNSDKDSSSRYSSPLITTNWPQPASAPPLSEPAKQALSKLPQPEELEAQLDQLPRQRSGHIASNSRGSKVDQPSVPAPRPRSIREGASKPESVAASSRPASAMSRASRMDAVMPASRPPSAIERASRFGPMPALSRPPSAAERMPRGEYLAAPSRPPSAAERFSKQYQVVLPPRPPSSLAHEVRVEQDLPLSRPASAVPKELLQTNEISASPVSQLSEINVNQFDAFTASPVSPLLSPELAMNKRDSNVSSIWSYRKPVPKRPDSPASISTRASIREPLREAEAVADQSADRESTTDLRFSALGFRPLARQLDDVKEEPNLEMSTTDLRASTFKFPLPQRKSSLAHYEEFRLSRESKRKASLESAKAMAITVTPAAPGPEQHKPKKSSPLRVPPGAVTLDELRAIPSLRFSRVDLFEKLNEALDLQPDPPAEGGGDLTDDAPGELQESTGVMRLKYRSFFESLDNMASDPAAPLQVNADDKHTLDMLAKSPKPRKNVKLPKIQQWTPDDLMAEIDRLSIPSVGGLTQRLSELLPSLKRYYGGTGDAMEDETVKSALDEIRRLGAELIPELRESGSFMEEDSDLYEDTSASSSSGQETADSSIKIKHRPRSASSPGDMLITPLAELEATPAVQRSRSMSHGDASQQRDTATANEHSRASRRSIVGSPPESRPWNLDTSYPWAANITSIDISLPATNTRRDPVRHRPSRLRLHNDNADGGIVTTEIAAGSVCSEITETTTARTYSRTITHHRRTSKRSLLGSISRKIGLPRGTSIDNSGYATGPDILRGVDDRTVDPGDRYPTTGLSPPSALNIDEARSFFSDDSSQFETQTSSHGGGLRKRFSNLRTKIHPMSRTHSALEQRPMTSSGPTLRRSNSLFFARGVPKSTAEFDLHIDEAAGMPKTEVRAKKLVNRMKSLWYRGGELLRSLSGKRRPREGQDWDDDGESAVWEHV